MGAAAAAGIGFIGSLYAANQAADAQKEGANAQMQMAAPYLREAALALPRLRALAERYYAPRAGKDSPFLRAGHLENLAELERANRRSLAEIEHTYASRGNLGRARGERLRLTGELLGATNRENLSYGLAQENYRDSTAAQYQELLAALASLGGTGMRYASAGLTAQSRASSEWWSTLAKVLGKVGA